MKVSKNLEIKKCLHGKIQNTEIVMLYYGNAVQKTFIYA